MLDLQEITNTIYELENGDTTFENCLKLASLYIVIDKLNTRVDEGGNPQIQKELNDILPQYLKYVDIKRQFQLGIVSRDAVFRSIELLCTEIYEFLTILYNNTDMEEEREHLRKLFSRIFNIVSS